MAIFSLNKHQRELLASCIEIGLEGASDNHVDAGGENTEEDLIAIAAVLEELQESNADETEVTIMPKRIAETEGSRLHGLRNLAEEQRIG